MKRLSILVMLLTACGSGGAATTASPDTTFSLGTTVFDSAPTPIARGDWWQPGPDDSWNWQLQGPIDTSVDADAYDIDLFDTPATTISELHDAGRKVVCYFSAGSVEDWRPDVGGLPPEAIGEPLADWPGERWLDVTSPAVVALMESRLDLAVEKGCDAVEPDNTDGYEEYTGFSLSRADELGFLRGLAEAAHRRGLGIGLKNGVNLNDAVADIFDFALVEECFAYQECDRLEPFHAIGKAIWNAEYAQEFVDDPGPVCEQARRMGYRTLILPVELDGSFRIDCDSPGLSP